jgi:hypothetical protein
MNKCIICGDENIKRYLDLGLQPICNRFKRNRDEKEGLFPMSFGQCEVCAAVQLINNIPAKELIPIYEWIMYNEPEEHLDALAEKISYLPGLSKGSRICGISYKDASLLHRLKKLDFKGTWTLNLANDMNIQKRGAGIETIQDKLNNSKAKEIARCHGKSDIIIARHILEHSFKISDFLESLKELTTPNGYIIIEVPDCTKAIEVLDYTMLWEEHSVYFTSETLKSALDYNKFSIEYFECYPYSFENSLVVIAKVVNDKKDRQVQSINDDEKKRAQKFFYCFEERKEGYQNYLRNFKKEKGNIAVFGAGHLTASFINYYDLEQYISFVADDNQNKIGMYMPGSGLQIKSSLHLIKENIGLCLIGVNPQVEDKVIERNRDFMEKGGVFASIFPSDKLALKI